MNYGQVEIKTWKQRNEWLFEIKLDVDLDATVAESPCALQLIHHSGSHEIAWTRNSEETWDSKSTYIYKLDCFGWRHGKLDIYFGFRSTTSTPPALMILKKEAFAWASTSRSDLIGNNLSLCLKQVWWDHQIFHIVKSVFQNTV